MMEDNLQPESQQPNPAKDSLLKPPTESGVVYLSCIPTGFNVKLLREALSLHGEIGKIFLQPETKNPRPGQKVRRFKEGWVEFIDKRVAKRTARLLNNTKVGGKKKNQWSHELWNIKYLSKFRWSNLVEQMEFERVVHKQRMRLAVAQAKREVNFFTQNVAKQRRNERLEAKAAKREMTASDTPTTADTPITADTSSSPNAAETGAAETGATDPQLGPQADSALSASKSKADSGKRRRFDFKQRLTDEQVKAEKRRKPNGSDNTRKNAVFHETGDRAKPPSAKLLKALFSGGLE